LIDTQAFAPGEDFRTAIRRTMDDADVFVFFVSRKSLASSWVRFELDEADCALYEEGSGGVWRSSSRAQCCPRRCRRG